MAQLTGVALCQGCLHAVALVRGHVGSLGSVADVVGVGAASGRVAGGDDAGTRGDHQLGFS